MMGEYGSEWIPLYSIEFDEFKRENSDDDSKVIIPSEGYNDPSEPGVPIEFTEGLCPSDTSNDIFDDGTEDGPDKNRTGYSCGMLSRVSSAVAVIFVTIQIISK